MTKTNPFKFGSIVDGVHFYNREEELLRIKNTLSSGNNITLYAPRRYGKSSLVAKVLNELKKEGFTTVHFDFMTVYSQETFVENYSRDILKSQTVNLQSVVRKFSEVVKGIKPSISFDQNGVAELLLNFNEDIDKKDTLLNVINLPEVLASEKNKFSVAFDEFQEIEKLNGENFERLLRSQIQKHNNVSYVFLGSKTHLLKDMFNNKNRAFYNSAAIMSLNKIEKEKSVKYIKTAFFEHNIQISDEIAYYLIDKVDNIPYYIQFLSYEIWQNAIINKLDIITQEIVDWALETVIKLKDDYYWELTDKQSIHRKKLLFAISKDAVEFYSDKTSKKYNLGAASTTQKSIEVLVNEGILEKTKSKLEFSDPIYKIFIKRNL